MSNRWPVAAGEHGWPFMVAAERNTHLVAGRLRDAVQGGGRWHAFALLEADDNGLGCFELRGEFGLRDGRRRAGARIAAPT